MVYGRPRSCRVRPTAAGSLPHSLCHVRCEITATRSAPGASSIGCSIRPRNGRIPNISKWFEVTTCPNTRRERSPRLSGANIGVYAVMSAKTAFCALRSTKSGYEVVAYSSPSLLLVKMSTSAPGSRAGMGRSSTASTNENIAVLTPIPRPSDMMATNANPGLRRNQRIA